VQGDIEHDDQADVADPAVLMQQLGDPGGGDAHQDDRQQQAEDQHDGMLAGRAGHGQHIVERHRQVGDQDLHEGLLEGLGLLDPRLGGRIVVHRRGGVDLVLGACSRSSRHIFQQTQSSSTPPASRGR
jgi:hypothetical protein